MTWEDIKRKLTSRKLWLAIGSFVSLLLVALGMPEQQAARIVTIITAGASVIAYIIGEGLVDAAAATQPPVLLMENTTKAEDIIDTESDSETQEGADPPPEV